MRPHVVRSPVLGSLVYVPSGRVCVGRTRSSCVSDRPPDLLISGASTEIAGQAIHDGLFRGIRIRP